MELSVLNRCIERENQQLKGQSKKFQEEIEKLQSETKKINKQMHKILQPEQPRRSDRLEKKNSGLNILINVAGLS
jgi:hypothetical protein